MSTLEKAADGGGEEVHAARRWAEGMQGRTGRDENSWMGSELEQSQFLTNQPRVWGIPGWNADYDK